MSVWLEIIFVLINYYVYCSKTIYKKSLGEHIKVWWVVGVILECL